MTLCPLGSPPRFALRRVVRPTFRVEFEYDGDGYDFEEGGVVARSSRNVMRRTFFSEAAAYRWLARRAIFAKRDTYGDTRVTKCSLCESQPVDDGPLLREDDYDPGPQCRYHAEHRFRRLEQRLARWLRWRDRRRVAIAAEALCKTKNCLALPLAGKEHCGPCSKLLEQCRMVPDPQRKDIARAQGIAREDAILERKLGA